ncbi:diguanylate cyclase domain-containing protein [Methylobacterium sp. D54C]
MASLARIDPLTGLANRLGLREAFASVPPERPVAVRLLAIAASGATVARTGGDEFVILRPGLRTAAEAEDLARRMDASLREPFGIGGMEIRIAASVGYAVSEMPVASTIRWPAPTRFHIGSSERAGPTRRPG